MNLYSWPFRALYLFLLIFLAGTTQAQAQQAEAITVLANEVEINYPDSVTFRLELGAGSSIADAELTYQVGRDSCLSAGTRVPVQIDGTSLEWTWVMSRSGNPPPGAQMWWEWTITDEDGNRHSTPRLELTFTDDRFEWREITSDGSASSAPIQLYWYEGDEVGPILLDAAVSGLERLEDDTGIELQGEVQIFVYKDASDMREALLYVQDWAGGLAFSDYNTILLGVPPNLAEGWGSDTIRHELAHLVIGQFGRSCLGGSRPNWLEEGLATYAEGEPDEEVLIHIERGIQDGAFQPVRSLNGAFPAEGDEANAAYSQSFSLVDFLLKTHGQEKLQDLILELASAEGYDAALEKVYGFNADGLEVAWLASIGAPSRPIPAMPTPILAQYVPTSVPLDAALSVPTPVSGPRSGLPDEVAPAADEGPTGICGLSLIPLLFLAILWVPIRRNKGQF